MLRTARGIPTEAADVAVGRATAGQLLLAVAPPPHPQHSYALSGWPTWLIPAYRAGGHRPTVRLFSEER